MHDKKNLSEEQEQLLLTFRQYLEQRRYARKTITQYVNGLVNFLIWLGPVDIKIVKLPHLEQYQHFAFIQTNKSRSAQNIWVSAMKLFLSKAIDHKLEINLIERPRMAKQLPNVLSTSEMQSVLASIDNLKHYAMILCMYSCGLRRSELLHLKIQDIDSSRGVIRIRNSKGAKDRDVSLPNKLLDVLRLYYQKYRPQDYLFEGVKQKTYSTSSLRKVLRRALIKAGVKKRVSLHSLRHSYATHLVEKNINLRYIQEALGHKSSRTTEIYTHLSKEHIANMVSPIDDWMHVKVPSDVQKGTPNMQNGSVKGTNGKEGGTL